MEKKVFQMAALNDKQRWFCTIMDHLKLIRYTEQDKTGYVTVSPITGKTLVVWWNVEAIQFVYRVFIYIWNSQFFFDKEAEQHMDELIKLGWVNFNA